MARNMSFALTPWQFQAQIKTVTRRLGWRDLVPGDVVCGVEKGMGLKKGEKIKRYGPIEIVSNTPEPLNAISQEDVIREGFPFWTPEMFVDFLVRQHRCDPYSLVNRIEFKYLHEKIVNVTMGESFCIGCGCTDSIACNSADGPCYWLSNNSENGYGVCSYCDYLSG